MHLSIHADYARLTTKHEQIYMPMQKTEHKDVLRAFVKYINQAYNLMALPKFTQHLQELAELMNCPDLLAEELHR
jgi:hypothetical protein